MQSPRKADATLEISKIEDRQQSLAGERTHTAAILICLVGLAARVWAASGTFLNPDEALHFRLANQRSWALAYRESLTASHPPLLTFILYYWRGLGTSELWLRLPSVLAGVAFCWMFYKWLRQIAGPLAGFAGVLLAGLLPPMVLLSAEIRQYALLLAFLASAAYFLETALEQKSIRRMWGFSLFLYLAMLSHYSALFLAAALGLYAMARIVSERVPARLAAAWAIGQTGALALAAFLYKTHLAKLGAGESRTVLQGWMSEFYLNRSYFEAGRDNPLLFVIGHSFGVFQFVFGQLAIGDVAGLLFLAGLFSLIGGRSTTERLALARGRQVGMLLIISFAVVCGASLAHVYPYGGTRHSAVLAIPALAGVSIAICQLTREQWRQAVAATSLMVALCMVFGKQHQPYMTRAEQSRAHMSEAMTWLRQRAKSPDVVFTDYESELLLGHYLCGQRPLEIEESTQGFEAFSCDGVRVVSASYNTATLFDARNFSSAWDRLAQAYGLKMGTRVWVFQAGWKVDLGEDLRLHSGEFRDLRVESFGANIKLFKLAVGQRGADVAGMGSHLPAGELNPSARSVLSSGTARPYAVGFVTTPKLPE